MRVLNSRPDGATQSQKTHVQRGHTSDLPWPTTSQSLSLIPKQKQKSAGTKAGITAVTQSKGKHCK